MAYTVNLTHRGPQVIECIDLFDEARYGADKLFFRGRFEKTQDIFDQVTFALTKDNNTAEWGNGNPLTETPESGDLTNVPTIALNRYHIPNKKFWNNTPPSDVENPYKASAAVKFSIRVHFRDDFAYIDFGCPWELVDKGILDDTDETTAKDFIENFVLLHCHFISKEDALQIIDSIFPKTSANTAAYAMMRNAPQIITETTELVDEDGTIIAL
jgi:hypothetical protein